jgi:peroxidase
MVGCAWCRLPLFRQVYGKSFIEMNPAHGYPWDVVTPGGKPMVASHEMSLGYRFHDLIVHSVPVLDIRGNGPKVRLADTQFEARKFMDVGIESILRGMVSSDIPNFKSGVDEVIHTHRTVRSLRLLC